MIDIKSLRKIGKLLKKEVDQHIGELLRSAPLGKGAGGDVTHLVDKRAEDIVFEELRKLNTPVTLVSEECGIREIQGGGPRLLVDPIDGSRNAITGIPLFSTSIALVDGDRIGKTAIGYIINLVSGDEFWALKGSGSFLNGIQIHTQQGIRMKVAAYEAQIPRRDIPKIVPLLSLFDRARCFGSTALDLAFLARGAVSLFIVPSRSRSFDFAAGYLLVRESGGIITDLKGKSIENVEVGIKHSTPLLASANEEMHKKALDVLLGRGRYARKEENTGDCLSRNPKKKETKNPCPDCTFCQWCGDERCLKCRPLIHLPL